jgi:hypothetical protein
LLAAREALDGLSDGSCAKVKVRHTESDARPMTGSHDHGKRRSIEAGDWDPNGSRRSLGRVHAGEF